jgi:hypothetical protein
LSRLNRNYKYFWVPLPHGLPLIASYCNIEIPKERAAGGEPKPHTKRDWKNSEILRGKLKQIESEENSPKPKRGGGGRSGRDSGQWRNKRRPGA